MGPRASSDTERWTPAGCLIHGTFWDIWPYEYLQNGNSMRKATAAKGASSHNRISYEDNWQGTETKTMPSSTPTKPFSDSINKHATLAELWEIQPGHENWGQLEPTSGWSSGVTGQGIKLFVHRKRIQSGCGVQWLTRHMNLISTSGVPSTPDIPRWCVVHAESAA